MGQQPRQQHCREAGQPCLPPARQDHCPFPLDVHHWAGQGSHPESGTGLRPAKQCIFLHLENPPMGLAEPHPPLRALLADFYWVSRISQWGSQKPLCLEAKQCALPCLVLLFFFFPFFLGICF